jgi:ABC-type dipeptide/oligopeptide/nickel transport system ATPase component
VLRQGRAVATGPVESVFERNDDPYLAALLASAE